MKKKNLFRKKHYIDSDRIKRQDFAISTNNRLTYVYKTNNYNIILEIVCVSLEVAIENRWITIVYYDSHHDGTLHRHTRTSLETNSDVTDYLGVKKKRSLNKLLRWTIRDIQNNYLYYKREFINRCKVLDASIDIDMY